MADRISGRALILCAALGTVLWAGLASCALGRTVTHDTGGSVSAPFDGERGRVPSGRGT